MTNPKKTVLIVDDESAQRAWMRGVLRRQGYHVLEAADYSEALTVKAGHEREIDLFLIDLRLPGGSGYDLSFELLAAHPSSKILFVSGTAGAELCKYLTTPVPAVQFLHKPFAADELAGRVKELFEPAGNAMAAGAQAFIASERAEPVLQIGKAKSKRHSKC